MRMNFKSTKYQSTYFSDFCLVKLFLRHLVTIHHSFNMTLTSYEDMYLYMKICICIIYGNELDIILYHMDHLMR